MATKSRDLPELLKSLDVATRLGVSCTWLNDAARAGRILSIRVGGGEGPLRFIPEDIERWLEDARTSGRLVAGPLDRPLVRRLLSARESATAAARSRCACGRCAL